MNLLNMQTVCYQSEASLLPDSRSKQAFLQDVTLIHYI